MAGSEKPMCKFSSQCYRKNPQHLRDYRHPADEAELKEPQDDEVAEPPKKQRKIESFFKAGKSQEDQKEVDKEKPDEIKDVKGNSSGYVRESDSEEESSPPEDTTNAPESPIDTKENIKAKFLMDLPDDFYEFWELAKSVNSKNPQDAFKKSLGLQLVGPYDILAGKSKKLNSAGKRPCYLRHWRYFYDPPEFMTIVRGEDETQFHMGYFRDDPNEMPVFVASNAAKVNCTISSRGENIFAAFCWFIDDNIKKNPGSKARLTKVKDSICDWAKKKNFPTESRTKKMKDRDKQMNCRTFHGAGMVVPVDENEVGYREVPETPADLKKMFKKIVEAKSEKEKNSAFDPLMEIVMLVQFANDECDYGEGLELGLDLFSYGSSVFHSTVKNLLPLAYQLLGRHAFSDIILAHLEDRKHTADLSQLN